MTREKGYASVASNAQLKLAATAVTQATTADHIREATRQHGAKMGYKAFATSVARYLLTGKMTPEGVKADEAAATAVALEEDGKDAEAQAIYRLILGEHPDHPLAKEKEVNR
jgi:PAB1-binding protein PBP1